MRSEVIKDSWAGSHSCAIVDLGPSAITGVSQIRQLMKIERKLLLQMNMAESPSTSQIWKIIPTLLTKNAKAMRLISLRTKVDIRRISDDSLNKEWGALLMLGKGSWWLICSKKYLREKMQISKVWTIVRRLQYCLTIGKRVRISLPVQAPIEHLLK